MFEEYTGTPRGPAKLDYTSFRWDTEVKDGAMQRRATERRWLNVEDWR